MGLFRYKVRTTFVQKTKRNFFLLMAYFPFQMEIRQPSLLFFSMLMLALADASLKQPHPISFTEIGEVISSGSHYLVPLQLNIESLLGEVIPLQKAISNTSRNFEEIIRLVNINRGHASNDALMNFPDSLR